MRVAALALLALLLAARPALALCDGWTGTDTALEAGFQTLVVVDWSQTLNFTQHPRPTWGNGYETNSVLGHYPSRDRINTLIPLGMLAHAAVSCLLPAPYREAWQGLSFMAEAHAVMFNYSVGISP